MKNKHYVVLLTDPRSMRSSFKVVCLAHDVASDLKREEADALANALNLASCNQQTGFGADE